MKFTLNIDFARELAKSIFSAKPVCLPQYLAPIVENDKEKHTPG